MVLLSGTALSCGDDDGGETERMDSSAAADAGSADDADTGADAETEYVLSGEVSEVEGTAAECSATSDARSADGCYGFYCGTNSNSLKAALSEDAVCNSDAEVWLVCDGLGAREASRCARLHAQDSEPREGTRECMRENAELEPLSDACLECYLDSAACARQYCIAECLAGDSEGCDTCREDNGCTPDFYACSGLPNPR